MVGAFSEAWAEVRIHKTRVLMSLIGVAVAVAALTSVVGLGSIAEQAMIETYERQSGRPATLIVNVWGTGEVPPDALAVSAAFDTVVDRYQIEYAGAFTHSSQTVQFVDGAMPVTTMGVEVGYGTLHRVVMTNGRWFVEADEQRLAPALVVNEAFYARMGWPELSGHPTVTLLGDTKTAAVVVGVIPEKWEGEEPVMHMLNSAYLRITPPSVVAWSPPMLEAWVPTELSDELTFRIKRDIAGALGEGVNVDVSRQDYQAWGGTMDPFGPFKLIVTGVSILVLLLGALGLVNISMVTVKQRIREIGIRRSFGATAGRVFFAVMMESVVASAVAGVVGVMIAVLVIQSDLVQSWITSGFPVDLPPFPVEAAIIGIGAATLVGALAGLLPAIVAVRVKVINAIRY
nr:MULTISPECIES: ABC transporter permease [unclassified Cryobacterium]